MAVKKTYYPSVKKPGIYSDAEGVTDKELGLNNSDLENFSLGNWNSIRKNSKMIVSTDIGTSNPASEDPRGRPIRIKWGRDELLSFRGNLEDSDNTRANYSTNYPFASYFVKAERNNYGLFTITKVYTGNGDDGDGDDNLESYLTANNNTAEVTSTTGSNGVVMENDGFTLDINATAINGSGNTFIYLAFA